MKNLICNCCYSGFLYNKMGSKYDNPFFWNRITCKDFIKLMINFKKIDYENISLKLNKDIYKLDTAAMSPANASIILNDKNIRIQFNHYVYDKNYNIPTKIKQSDYVWNIHYVHIYNYIYDKFIKRQKRMNKEIKKFFIFVDNARQFDTINDYKEMFNTADKNKIDLYFFTEDKTIKYESKYVHIFYEKILFEHLTEKYCTFFEELTK